MNRRHNKLDEKWIAKLVKEASAGEWVEEVDEVTGIVRGRLGVRVRFGMVHIFFKSLAHVACLSVGS